MKKHLISAISFLHLKFFGQKMGKEMGVFLCNMSWSLISGVFALPLVMLVNTLAGRIMGPAEYGQYMLITVVSSYMVLFIFFGLDTATVKAVVKASTKQGKGREFYSAFLFVVLSLVAVSLVCFLGAPLFEKLTGITRTILYFALLYSITSSLKAVLNVLTRGLEEFRLQAEGRALEAVALIIFFLIAFVALGKSSYIAYIIIISLAAILLTIYLWWRLKGYFAGFSIKGLKAQLSEGRFFMLCALLGTIFYSSDKILISKYFGLSDLGIYSAYYTGSLTMVASLSLLFTNVLLPAGAKTEDKKFTDKLRPLLIKGFIPLYVLCFCFLVTFLFLFGKEFTMRIDYLLLFALAATLYFYNNLYNAVILDIDKKNYIKYFLSTNAINAVTIIAYILICIYFPSINLIVVGFVANLFIALLIQQAFVAKMRYGKQQKI